MAHTGRQATSAEFCEALDSRRFAAPDGVRARACPESVTNAAPSPRGAIDALVAGCELDGAKLGNRRVITLPGISVTVDEMTAALREVAGDEVVKLIRREPDERVEKIVGSWPGRWDTSRAEALGLKGDASFVDVIRAYLEDERR
ncbi:hypothetical protein WI73_32510 [Burkholderia ubonensis]|nr:hypothetical protein WI73_32510 [Burkholderia ubonensis]